MFSQQKNRLTTGFEGFFNVALVMRDAQKITQKKWLFFGNLLGCVLLCYPKNHSLGIFHSLETNGI